MSLTVMGKLATMCIGVSMYAGVCCGAPQVPGPSSGTDSLSHRKLFGGHNPFSRPTMAPTNGKIWDDNILYGMHCTKITERQLKIGGTPKHEQQARFLKGEGTLADAEVFCSHNIYCAGVSMEKSCTPNRFGQPEVAATLCYNFSKTSAGHGDCVYKRPNYVPPPPPPPPFKAVPGSLCADIQAAVPANVCELTTCDLQTGIKISCDIDDPISFNAKFTMDVCSVPAAIKFDITQPTTHLKFKKSVTEGHTVAIDVPGLSMPYKFEGFGVDLGVVTKVSMLGSLSQMRIKIGLDACGTVKIPMLSGHKCAEDIPGLGSLFPINVLTITKSFSSFCKGYKAPPTPPPTPQTHTTTHGCADNKDGWKGVESSCKKLVSVGWCSTGKYTTQVKQNCPSSCGSCSSSCFDASIPLSTSPAVTCSQLRSFCSNSEYHDLMKQECPKTCGMCSGH